MRRIVTGLIAIACFCPLALRAEIVRFDITERAPAFSGRSFGSVGTYERITARATFALNPADDRNAVITDLALAPRNADGKVEATADVVKASSALRAHNKWPAPTMPPCANTSPTTISWTPSPSIRSREATSSSASATRRAGSTA
jgi:hypothetical protein